LVRLINDRGYYWFDEIPRLGLNMAQRVVQWLKLHEADLSVEISDRALIAPRIRQAATDLSAVALSPEQVRSVGIVPLESLWIPPELDGSRGSNRQELAYNTLHVNTDYEAI